MANPTDSNNAPDDFALLGLNREFRIDPVQLDDALARASNEISASGGQRTDELRARLEAARQRLADPVRRARYLIDLLAGPDDSQTSPTTDAQTPFGQQVAAAKDSTAISSLRASMLADRQSRIDHIATLFSAPRNVPNPNVQWNRDSAIRQDLAAIEVIDRLLTQLASHG